VRKCASILHANAELKMEIAVESSAKAVIPRAKIHIADVGTWLAI